MRGAKDKVAKPAVMPLPSMHMDKRDIFTFYCLKFGDLSLK